MSFVKNIFTQDVDELPSVLSAVLPWCRIVELTSGESSTTIAYGDAVCFDTTATDAAAATFISTAAEATAMAAALGKCIQLPTGTTTGKWVRGVALESIAPGATGKVVVSGFCPKVRITDADVAAGDGLVGDGEAAGEVEKYAAGTHTAQVPFAVALTSDTTNDGYVCAWIGR